MAWIETIPTKDADSTLATLYAQVVDPANGQLDHIMQIHSLHPAGLAAHFALYQACMRGTKTLRKVDRELVALVVSRQNECHY